jgi:hypothetical protein
LWIFPFFPCWPLGFLWHLFMTSFFIRYRFENFVCRGDNWLTATTLLFGARKVKYCVHVEFDLLLVIICWENKCGTVFFLVTFVVILEYYVVVINGNVLGDISVGIKLCLSHGLSHNCF